MTAVFTFEKEQYTVLDTGPAFRSVLDYLRELDESTEPLVPAPLLHEHHIGRVNFLVFSMPRDWSPYEVQDDLNSIGLFLGDPEGLTEAEAQQYARAGAQVHELDEVWDLAANRLHAMAEVLDRDPSTDDEVDELIDEAFISTYGGYLERSAWRLQRSVSTYGPLYNMAMVQLVDVAAPREKTNTWYSFWLRLQRATLVGRQQFGQLTPAQYVYAMGIHGPEDRLQVAATTFRDIEPYPIQIDPTFLCLNTRVVEDLLVVQDRLSELELEPSFVFPPPQGYVIPQARAVGTRYFAPIGFSNPKKLKNRLLR